MATELDARLITPLQLRNDVARGLLNRARTLIAEALVNFDVPATRYAHAVDAATCAAQALASVQVRGYRPDAPVWAQLAVSPRFAIGQVRSWFPRFIVATTMREAIAKGIRDQVTGPAATDMLSDAVAWLHVVEWEFGMPYRPSAVG